MPRVRLLRPAYLLTAAGLLLTLMLAATPASGGPPASPAATAVPAWTTYHRNPARTGVGFATPSLRTVARAWTSPTLDGHIYAEPLVLGNRVFVVTENDSLYALDATTGRVLWRTHVGTPVPLSALPCGNIDPSGITSTPVIDRASGRLFAVGEMRTATGGVAHQMVAVDIATGALRMRRTIDPAGMNPFPQLQRAALALSRGRVYASFGGRTGDCGDYHGWVVGIRTDGTGPAVVYKTPTERMGGIWGPSGPAVDTATGNLFVSVGNGTFTAPYDFSDSVTTLSPAMQRLGFFAPSIWRDDNAKDLDLSSTGPSLLQNGLLFQVGKRGIGYLLHAAKLGGIGGQAFQAPVCAAYGGNAYLAPMIYVPCNDGIRAVRVGAGPSFKVIWHGPSTVIGPPIVAGGLVWSVETHHSGLYGLDPATGAVVVHMTIGPVMHFTTPTAAGGRLLVAATDHVVAFRPAATG